MVALSLQIMERRAAAAAVLDRLALMAPLGLAALVEMASALASLEQALLMRAVAAGEDQVAVALVALAVAALARPQLLLATMALMVSVAAVAALATAATASSSSGGQYENLRSRTQRARHCNLEMESMT